jgi:hypothetical protein
MLGDTPRKCQGITSVSIESNRHFIPHSPDLAPSDFFLSGHVKGKLMEYRAETPSELLVRIWVILAEISRETLNAVFLDWMERWQKFVQADDKYVG